jgi:hypothetical protein
VIQKQDPFKSFKSRSRISRKNRSAYRNSARISTIVQPTENPREYRRSFSLQKFCENIDDVAEFTGLSPPDEEFQFKNILPIPNCLTKVFVHLESTSPYLVATKFLDELKDENILNNSMLSTSTSGYNPAGEIDNESQSVQAKKELSPEKKDIQPEKQDSIQPDDLLHVIQFCHLCATGKIPPILYSLSTDAETLDWFRLISTSLLSKKTTSNKRQNPATPEDDPDSASTSPEHKISKKDHYLINTMIKLHNTMDKTSKNKEEKEPGFNRLESHHKNLILNASATPPFSSAVDSPTEFCMNFLSKKSQFKVKDMLLHQFHTDRIAFNPNSTFITNLWNSEFFWYCQTLLQV